MGGDRPCSSGNNNGCHTGLNKAVTSLQISGRTKRDKILDDVVVEEGMKGGRSFDAVEHFSHRVHVEPLHFSRSAATV